MNITQTQFMNILDNLSETIGINKTLWNEHKKNLYLPQLVSFVIELSWLEQIEDENTKILRQVFKELRSTGEFSFKKEKE